MLAGWFFSFVPFAGSEAAPVGDGGFKGFEGFEGDNRRVSLRFKEVWMSENASGFDIDNGETFSRADFIVGIYIAVCCSHPVKISAGFVQGGLIDRDHTFGHEINVPVHRCALYDSEKAIADWALTWEWFLSPPRLLMRW